MEEKQFYVSNKELLAAYVNWFAAIESNLLEGKEEPKLPDFIVDCMMRICTKLSYAPNFVGYTYKEDMVGDALIDCIRFAKKFNPNKIIYKVTLDIIQGNLQKKDALYQEDGLRGRIKFHNPKTGLTSFAMAEPRDFNVDAILKSNDDSVICKVKSINSHTADNPFSFLTTIAFNAFLRRIDKEKEESYVRAELIAKSPMSDFLESQNHDDEEFMNSYVDFLLTAGYNDNHIPQSIKRSNAKKKAKADQKLEDEFNPFAEFEIDE